MNIQVVTRCVGEQEQESEREWGNILGFVYVLGHST